MTAERKIALVARMLMNRYSYVDVDAQAAGKKAVATARAILLAVGAIRKRRKIT